MQEKRIKEELADTLQQFKQSLYLEIVKSSDELIEIDDKKKAVDKPDIKDYKNVKEKPKAQKKKLTKDTIQFNIIEGFKKDAEIILEDRNDFGCDVFSKKCKKCDHETHSEGVLRLHKVEDHNRKKSKENIILGFKNDVQDHVAFFNEKKKN